MSQTIDLEGQENDLIIKINNIVIMQITNRIDEDFVEIEVLDTDGNQVLSQSVSAYVLGLVE